LLFLDVLVVISFIVEVGLPKKILSAKINHDFHAIAMETLDLTLLPRLSESGFK